MSSSRIQPVHLGATALLLASQVVQVRAYRYCDDDDNDGDWNCHHRLSDPVRAGIAVACAVLAILTGILFYTYYKRRNRARMAMGTVITPGPHPPHHPHQPPNSQWHGPPGSMPPPPPPPVGGYHGAQPYPSQQFQHGGHQGWEQGNQGGYPNYPPPPGPPPPPMGAGEKGGAPPEYGYAQNQPHGNPV